VGLLGGSFGLSIRREYPDCHVVGVSRGKSSRDSAIERESVHEATDDMYAACNNADLVVVSTPVNRVAEIIISIADACDDQAIVTDLGSTKATIVSSVETNESARRKFVGAHPIAGGEKTGAQHARDDLFLNRNVVLTPTDATDPHRVEQCKVLWQRLGAQVVMMSPQEHDQAVATISHIPHLIASLLVELPDQQSRSLAGSGWLDTTRVASGDPEMWTAICQENRLAIAAELGRFGDSVHQLKEMILHGKDANLMAILDRAKQVRDAIAASSSRS
jgi:prephenate dehydrogenase